MNYRRVLDRLFDYLPQDETVRISESYLMRVGNYLHNDTLIKLGLTKEEVMAFGIPPYEMAAPRTEEERTARNERVCAAYGKVVGIIASKLNGDVLGPQKKGKALDPLFDCLPSEEVVRSKEESKSMFIASASPRYLYSETLVKLGLTAEEISSFDIKAIVLPKGAKGTQDEQRADVQKSRLQEGCATFGKVAGIVALKLNGDLGDACQGVETAFAGFYGPSVKKGIGPSGD